LLYSQHRRELSRAPELTHSGNRREDKRIKFRSKASNSALLRIECVFGLVLGVFAGGVQGVISGLSRISEYLIDGPAQIKRSIPSLGKRFNLLSE
jgi:hypothetical protein